MSYQQPSNKREQQPFNSWTEYQSVNPSPRGATMLHRSRVGAFAITIAFVIFPGAFVLGQEQIRTSGPQIAGVGGELPGAHTSRQRDSRGTRVDRDVDTVEDL